MPILYILAGPTASGKTHYAIEFARIHHCEILSCDASSFYKGMDIGTAKPTQEERQTVRHWGIDLIDPCEHFSIKDYIHYAQHCVQNVFQHGKNVLVVGGSGFYIKSFLEPIVDAIQPSSEALHKITELENKGGLPALVQFLWNKNPQLPPYFDLKNPRKVKKALERCLTTGLPLIDIEAHLKQQPCIFQSLKKVILCLYKPLELLKLRIRLRTRKMLTSGLIEEVQRLQAQHSFRFNGPAARAIGYREILDFLRYPISIKDLEEKINQNTYTLVKKQLTWFRHQIHFDHYIY